jgi:hypothetical protein
MPKVGIEPTLPGGNRILSRAVRSRRASAHLRNGFADSGLQSSSTVLSRLLSAGLVALLLPRAYSAGRVRSCVGKRAARRPRGGGARSRATRGSRSRFNLRYGPGALVRHRGLQGGFTHCNAADLEDLQDQHYVRITKRTQRVSRGPDSRGSAQSWTLWQVAVTIEGSRRHDVLERAKADATALTLDSAVSDHDEEAAARIDEAAVRRFDRLIFDLYEVCDAGHSPLDRMPSNQRKSFPSDRVSGVPGRTRVPRQP